MKVFAIATILAAVVSAAPTKDSYPPPAGAIPPYGVVSPPLNSVTPPVNGGSPPGGNDGVNKHTLPPLPPVTGNNSEDSHVCPSGLLYTNPQCCSDDVIGITDLDCKVPSRAPIDGADFGAICAAVGREPRCCAIPVAGQALLCVASIGAN